MNKWMILVLASQLLSQEPGPSREGTTTLFGYVYDEYDGFQVQSAWVFVDGTNLTASTDSWGHYEIADVPVVPLTADFSADVLSGPFPLSVQFYGFTEGGSPVVKITHPGYLDWREDHISCVVNGYTNVSAELHPKCRMRISAEWDYYQYMNPVDAFLKTPLIGGQAYQINSVAPEGSLGAPPYALFQKRDLGSYGKLIYLTFAELYGGTYRYYLHVDKLGNGWGYDVPTVRIFDEDSLICTVNAYIIGEGYYWHVCDITGPGGEITVVDQWLNNPPPVVESMGNVPEKQALTGNSSKMTGHRTFSWDFGDGSTSSEQDPIHIYSAAGTYTVSLSVSDGVTETIETKQNYIGVGVSGIIENENIAMTVRPNPASEEILVGWPDFNGGPAVLSEWKIFDSQGRLVLEGNWAVNPSQDLRIDISGFNHGIYFIRVTDSRGNSGYCKFITD